MGGNCHSVALLKIREVEDTTSTLRYLNILGGPKK